VALKGLSDIVTSGGSNLGIVLHVECSIALLHGHVKQH
jgi:hypothetical protein